MIIIINNLTTPKENSENPYICKKCTEKCTAQEYGDSYTTILITTVTRFKTLNTHCTPERIHTDNKNDKKKGQKTQAKT